MWRRVKSDQVVRHLKPRQLVSTKKAILSENTVEWAIGNASEEKHSLPSSIAVIAIQEQLPHQVPTVTPRRPMNLS